MRIPPESNEFRSMKRRSERASDHSKRGKSLLRCSPGFRSSPGFRFSPGFHLRSTSGPRYDLILVHKLLLNLSGVTREGFPRRGTLTNGARDPHE